MPANLNEPEIASRFGALDSTAIRDGACVSAHHLRELARSSNRLRLRRELLARLTFDLSTAPNARGVLRGVATWPQWSRLTWSSLPVPKPPATRRATAYLIVQVSNHATIFFQLSTRARPFEPRVTFRTPLLTCHGNGTDSYQRYVLTDIPLAPGRPLEAFDLWVLGTASDDAVLPVDDGTVAELRPDSFVSTVSGTSWIAGDAPGVYVRFVDEDGNLLVSPRTVTGVVSVDLSTGVVGQRFAPSLTDAEVRLCQGCRYQYRMLPRYSIADLAIYGEE